MTESADLVDSFYKALPKNILGKDWHANGKRTPSYKNKLRTLYRHWDKIDPVKAIQNIAQNQLEDWAIGKASSKATKGLLKSGTNDILPGSKLGANTPSVDWSSLGL